MANVNPNITAQAIRAYPRAAPEVFSRLLDRGIFSLEEEAGEGRGEGGLIW
jgi:hypothetical protein